MPRWFLVLGALCASLLAQPPDSRPAPSNVRGAPFPRIQADRRVTFEIKAPTARSVQVMPGGGSNGLGKGPFDMTRGPDGTWSVTVGPVQPGFHYYWLVVDGVSVNDPASETFFGWGRHSSGIEVPDPTLDFYEPMDVPHGDIHIHWYRSSVTGEMRRAFAYTPPGYGSTPGSRYPVLYLQHGSGESERGWTSQGRANFILDNLIAAGKARPMIVVMDNGYATRAGATPQPNTRGNEAFGDVVVKDLIPEIDRSYRTRPDRLNRAIAGLSMGGGQALAIGLEHLDLFASIGNFSGAGRNFDPKTAYNGAFSDPASLNRKLKLFWFGCGTEDFLYEGAKRMHATLDQLGVRHSWYESPGLHEWQVWRRHLHEFAQLLFRQAP